MKNKPLFKIPATNTVIGLYDILIISFIVLFRAMVFDFNHIPSSSMEPTLQINDHLVTKKFAYSVRAPLTTDHQLTDVETPEKADIVTFMFDDIGNKLAIKRVIAHAGDVVSVVGTDVFVNGEKLERSLVIEDENQWIFNETHNGKTYTVKYMKGTPSAMLPKRSAEFKVPEGHVFVMGDNRDNSFDARFAKAGGIPLERIHGKAEFVLANYSILGLELPSRFLIDL
ncbi:signal peptidase I [Vibrio crassostreae]|uniref:signal peptidase I n=1 Tax=Vibrio crassostreae TaxID=246167 RepID=UPI001B304355|nr:signal peptidase I [Vibrio crassostreae]